MVEFSDPAWWPKPPPRPPRHIPLPTILFGSIVPLGLVAAIVVFVVTQNGSTPKTVRSVAAFESCLSSHHAQGVAPGSGGRGAPAAVRACQALLPPGVAVGSIAPSGAAARAAQAQFETCVENALAGLPNHGRGGGRFGGGLSSGARAAIGVCETLATEGGGGGGAAGGGGSAPAPAPAAPKI